MTQLIKDFNLIVNPADISVAHRLGRKPDQGPDKRKIVVELCRRETKQDLLKACRVVKPRNFYVNETLTRTRSTVLYGLRQARKKYPNELVSSWPSDCLNYFIGFNSKSVLVVVRIAFQAIETTYLINEWCNVI